MNKKTWIIAAVLLLAFFSCKTETDPEPDPSPEKMPTPTGFRILSNSNHTVQLGWNTSPGTRGYALEWRLDTRDSYRYKGLTGGEDRYTITFNVSDVGEFCDFRLKALDWNPDGYGLTGSRLDSDWVRIYDEIY